MERAGYARTRHHPAFYPSSGRPDGLHPGRNGQRAKRTIPDQQSSAYEPGYKMPSTRDVVVYESPIQILADSPSAYRREPDCLHFFEEVPTVWDETRVLAAEIGRYVAVARRSGQRWFIGVLNNSEARSLDLDVSFLSAKEIATTVWKDGPNADRDGRDFQMRTQKIVPQQKLHVELAPGGGWVGMTESTQAKK